MEGAFEMEVAGAGKDCYDDDGDAVKRTGTLMTASAHIITAVIGSGVLSLSWALAQLGWIVGPIALFAFSLITWFCSSLLCDCLKPSDPTKGKKNVTYMEVVRDVLGGWKFRLCGLAQYINLFGVSIGYAITTGISMAAIKRSHCFHKNGHDAGCQESYTVYMVIFACIEILLSQMPNFHELWWLSVLAAVMSFAYSFIGLGLSIAKVAEGGHARTTLTGVTVGVDVSGSDKVWRSFQALGNIAFAYSYSIVLIEIQDTLKPKPAPNEVMKKAALVGVSTTSVFYILCGTLGYAAFGNNAPGNFLTGFGFYEPFWLIDIGNICIVVHLIGAYQVFVQPLFQFVETWIQVRWPDNSYMTSEHIVSIPGVGKYSVNLFRLVWRTAYVAATTVVAMLFPFFNDFLGLIGALAFWPLTVYFPIEMYIVQAKVLKFSGTWLLLQGLSVVCLFVSIAAACGSVQGLGDSVSGYKPFKATT